MALGRCLVLLVGTAAQSMNRFWPQETPPPLCHPSAVIGGRVRWTAAVQVMAGAVVQGGCNLGFGVVINSRASIDNDCHLGAHTIIGPGAVLCGVSALAKVPT
jgi:UDP-3-O-[3-hydroxymyristoyl] glucosamine N-acyltransferase